jgi:hypothetical protein
MSAKAKSLAIAKSLFFRLGPRAVTSPERTSTHHGVGADLVSSAHAAIVPSERGGQAGAMFEATGLRIARLDGVLNGEEMATKHAVLRAARDEIDIRYESEV